VTGAAGGLDVAVHVLPEGLRNQAGGLGGLVRAIEEPEQRGSSKVGLPPLDPRNEVGWVQRLAGHVSLHQHDVVFDDSFHRNDTLRPDSLHCQEQFVAECCDGENAHYDRAHMPRVRQVVLPKFGAYLVSIREARQWKQAQAADIAKRRRIPLGYQALRGLEEGTTQSPDSTLIQAAADLYELPFEMLVAMVIRERYGIDLVRPDGKEGSTPHQGGADGPASARILELEHRLSAATAVIRELQDVANHLTDLAVRGVETLEAPSAAATRRTRRRKTG
jgi:hypothetical protein